MKVAPDALLSVLESFSGGDETYTEAACHPGVVKRAIAQARALRAVARAAGRHIDRVRLEIAGTTDAFERTEVGLRDALSRLARVSGGTKGGRK